MPSGTVISIDFAALAVQILALAVNSVVGTAMRVVAKRQQGRHVVIGDQPDVAALAAVAAVRAALHDRALTSERHAARAAIAAAHVELAFVDELRHQRNATGHPQPRSVCFKPRVASSDADRTRVGSRAPAP